MDVQAAAGPVRVRFGHERRLAAVAPRHRLDDAAEQHRLVRDPENIFFMLQVDLELPGRNSAMAVEAGTFCSSGRDRDVAHEVGVG